MSKKYRIGYLDEDEGYQAKFYQAFKNEFDILEKLSLETNKKIPLPIKNLKTAKILHNRNCEKYQLKKEIENILKV